MSNDSESSTGSSSTDLSQFGVSTNGGKKSSRGPGRPPKKQVNSSSNSACTWCADSKVPLTFIINQSCTQKEFCSENCVAEFRNAYRKGACLVCDNVIRENAPHRAYCSTFCLNSDTAAAAMMDQSNGTAKETNASATSGSNSKSSSSTSKTTTSATNNNNSTAENLNTAGPASSEMRLANYGRSSSGSGGGGKFQYEQLNVFDWNVYLKVRSIGKFLNSKVKIAYVTSSLTTMSLPFLSFFFNTSRKPTVFLHRSTASSSPRCHP